MWSNGSRKGGSAVKAKIAVFGSMESIDCLKEYVTNDVDVAPFTYLKTEEIIPLIEQAFMCDTYVFLKPFAYCYAKDYLAKKRLPSIPIFLDEYMILTNLYKIKRDAQLSSKRLSIDVMDQDVVKNVLTELHIHDVTHVYHYDNQLTNIEHIVTFIKHYGQKGKSNMP